MIQAIVSAVRSYLQPKSPSPLGEFPDWTGGANGSCTPLPGDVLLRDPQCQRLVSDLKDAFGHDSQIFDVRVYPLLCRFAELVQLLPASQYSHHCDPCGLLVHSLDVSIRAMLASSNIRPFMPHHDNLPSLKVERLEIDTRIALLLYALCHDIGKVRLNCKVRLVNRHTGEFLDSNFYEVGVQAGRWHQSIYEWAVEQTNGQLDDVSYTWTWIVSDPDSNHSADTITAIHALLATEHQLLDSSVFKKLFDEPRLDSPHPFDKLVRACDHQSCNVALSSEGPNRRFDSGAFTRQQMECFFFLRYLADHFHDCPRYNDGIFISSDVLNNAKRRLPDSEDFYSINSLINAKTRLPMFFKSSGLASHCPELLDFSDELHKLDSTQGIVLNAGCREHIEASYRDGVHGKTRESSPINSNPAEIPARSNVAHTPIDSSGDDISAHGDSVATVSDLNAEHDPPSDPYTLSDSELRAMSEKFTDMVESLPKKTFSRPNLSTVLDGRITLCHKPLWDCLTGAGIPNEKIFFQLSQKYSSNRWSATPGKIHTLTFSEAYSAKLLAGKAGRTSSQTPNTDASSGVEDKSAPFEYPSMSDFLASIFDRLRSDPSLLGAGDMVSLDGNLLRIRMSLVDDFLGRKSARGQLYTYLETEQLLARRNKSYIFLHTSSSEVAACLAELQLDE